MKHGTAIYFFLNILYVAFGETCKQENRTKIYEPMDTTLSNLVQTNETLKNYYDYLLHHFQNLSEIVKEGQPKPIDGSLKKYTWSCTTENEEDESYLGAVATEYNLLG